MYSRTKTEQFWEWAEREREKRNLTWYAVERLANLANATLSERARELKEPTITTVKALADVFDIPREFVFTKAGMLPARIIGENDTDELVHYYHALNEYNRNVLRRMAHILHEQQQKYKIEG